MSDIERRYTMVPVEARTKGDKRTIGGYAAVFNKLSQNLGGFVEQVDSRMFDKSRGNGWPDVLARYNHDDNMLLGTIGGGTLRLTVDDTGLLYEVDPPQARADIVELVERGDVRKSSFAFRLFPEGDDWGLSDQGYPVRTLLSGQLVDVAPVNLPAYSDSTVGMRCEIALRSLSVKVDAPIEDLVQLAADNELRKLFTRSDGTQSTKKVWGTAALAQMKAKADPAI
jgi:Escherichia/Staphylococcus phage prohead protease